MKVLVILAVLAFSQVSAPAQAIDASDGDIRHCVSVSEFDYTYSALRPTRRELAKRWEVAGRGFREPLPMDLGPDTWKWRAYPACGFSKDQAWVSIVFDPATGKSKATVRSVYIGAEPTTAERAVRP